MGEVKRGLRLGWEADLQDRRDDVRARARFLLDHIDDCTTVEDIGRLLDQTRDTSWETR